MSLGIILKRSCYALVLLVVLLFSYNNEVKSTSFKVNVQDDLIAAIEEANGPTTIVVDGVIEITDTITISSEKDITFITADKSSNGLIVRDTFENNMIIIEEGAKLTIGDNDGQSDNISIDGNMMAKDSLIKNKGTLILNSGSIENANIDNNEKYYGGGVYVDRNATFIMNGGRIENNILYSKTSGLAGAGIFIQNTGNFTMNGGIITNNEALSGSHSGSYGGGIYSNGTNVNLYAGTISNNDATNGGGIYIESNSKANFQNTLIYENIAEEEGGGIWNCSTGEIISYDGVVINKNTSKIVADDLFFEERNNPVDQSNWYNDNSSLITFSDIFKNSVITIENTEASGFKAFNISTKLFSGGTISWYEDMENNRFNISSSTTIDSNKLNSNGKIALHSEVNETDFENANKKSTLNITNNTSTRGAGIANNGEITFDAVVSNDIEYMNLKVIKEWNGDEDDTSTRPDTIEIQVLQDNEELEGYTAELSEDNGWQYDFYELPINYLFNDVEIDYVYSVFEKDVEGYTTTYSNLIYDELNNVYIITITNTKITNEEDTTKEDDNNITPVVNDDSTNNDIAQTGNSILFFVVVLLTGMTGLIITKTLLMRKRLKK